MIGVFLVPWPVRGIRAPYLWVFYKWLTVLRERALFIVGEDYLRAPAEHAAQGRWELDPIRMRDNGYAVPDAASFARHVMACVPDALFDALLADCGGNPVALFRRMLTERLPALESALADALDRAPRGALEAVVSWCNCPSLEAAAAARGIPVVHLEVGPLRAPLYRPTAYLDFTGVNGNTEAARRFAEQSSCARPVDPERLRRFFFLPALPPKTGEARVGLALQVDDDSNLVAFGKGFDNQALLVHANLAYRAPEVLVRSHPGSQFGARPVWFEVDNSYDSLAFILRCREVLTINSSLALEALLLDTPATALGDCAFRFVIEAPDAPSRSARLAFFLFAYLIPEALQFDLDYLRFRLSRPSETSIVARHASGWLGRCVDSDASGDAWSAIEAALAAAELA